MDISGNICDVVAGLFSTAHITIIANRIVHLEIKFTSQHITCWNYLNNFYCTIMHRVLLLTDALNILLPVVIFVHGGRAMLV